MANFKFMELGNCTWISPKHRYTITSIKMSQFLPTVTPTHDFWSPSILTPHGWTDVRSHKVPVRPSKGGGGQFPWWQSTAIALGKEDSRGHFLYHSVPFSPIGDSNIKQQTCFGRLQHLSPPPADLLIDICWLKRNIIGKINWLSTDIMFSFIKSENQEDARGCSWFRPSLQ